jgi:hypothetical protein
MSRRFVCSILIVGLLGGLAWYSAFLAANRIYQVDECQNIYMARVLATGQTAEFFTNASLFLIGPLSWLTNTLESSENIFAAGRLLFLAIFWLNLFLIALIAGKKIRSAEGMLALAGAATLAPLWDYGFEIRHDNLILTGILLIWWLVRVRPMGLPSYLGAGAITVALLFIAVKSVVYVLPLACAVLLFPPPGHQRARLHLTLAWLGGAVLGLLAIRLSYGTGGKWDIYLSVFHGVAKYSAGTEGSVRFAPWYTLSRLPAQIPLLSALSIAAIIAVVVELVRRGRTALTWNGTLPEVLLATGALVGLFLNPAPFTYNVLHLVPYLFLLVFSYGRSLWQELQAKPVLWPALGSIVLLGHLVPFGLSVKRHADYRNYRQTAFMRLAESLTRPGTDAVYDGIGMVPTRRSIHYNWYLHSLNIRSFLNGSTPKVREMLAARPAAVLIRSYRTDWLTKEDQEFIQSRYVPLADDFWVLGKELAAGGGDVEIIHPGRYCIAAAGNSTNSVCSVDGMACAEKPVELATGSHHIESSSTQGLKVYWVGPKLERVEPMGIGDHHKLFVNGY